MSKVLIVIDMQNDFIDGALGTSEARVIVPHVKNKIEQYRQNDDVVVFTQDTHKPNYLNTKEGRHLPVKHCVYETDGWQIHDELDTVGLPIVCKDTFGFPDWYIHFAEWEEADEIELVGLCTDICVISNAMILKAAFPEVNIVVDASCCAGVTPESHENALKAMEMCQIEIRR